MNNNRGGKCSLSPLPLRSDPSPGRIPNQPIDCAPRPQAIRRQSSTTEEILIARGFRRQSTTEEMIRCRNFRRQSSQSDDVCQRFVACFIGNFFNWAPYQQYFKLFLPVSTFFSTLWLLLTFRYRGRRGKWSKQAGSTARKARRRKKTFR